MQPSEVELEDSFEKLLEEIIEAAEEHSTQQIILKKFLQAHPDKLSVRFQYTYLGQSLEKLLRELKRSSEITEDNVDLLFEMVTSVDSTHLKRAFNKHNHLIKRIQDPNYKSIDSAVTHVITEKMGSTWFTFSHEIGVPDGTIDEIDNTSDNNQERIERILYWISTKIPEDLQVDKILNALRRSGRKDLEEEVVGIIKLNIYK